MGKIKLLNTQLTNMIAAGEVVERPMGIVKELVENSIDAHSKNIIVEIKNGGLDLIRVIDDGDGMDKDDLLLAFQRHATSKIFKNEDLFNINTFGFRGEALPSISSVSRVEIISSINDVGNKLIIDNGNIISINETASNKGTDISISELFYKTPARLKHLKTSYYENSLINDLIIKFAFSNPQISFSLISDDKVAFKSKGNNNLLEVLFNVFGKDATKSAIKVSESNYDFNIDGYLLQPQYNKPTKYSIYIFINNRIVRPYRLINSVADAYSEYLPKEKYPIVVLNISMDTRLIDVNVHPTKLEVRISKEKELEGLIKETIINSFKKDISPYELKPNVKVENLSFENDFVYKNNDEEIINISKNEEIIDTPKENSYETFTVVNDKLFESDDNYLNPAFPNMNVIGQFHKKFILAEGEKGLYVIDQHAAEERVHFEEILDMLESNDTKYTDLLIPILIHSTNDVVKNVEELNEQIKDMNIKFEIFSDEDLIVRTLPLWMKDVDENKFLNDLIDLFKAERLKDRFSLNRKSIATMACHSSIRFNKSLTIEESKEVVRKLSKAKQPFNCPHGRPTFVLLEDKYLEKEFLR